MDKKSQAAMEFILTYGWAILAVITVISGLAYFGVLNFDSFFPDKCLSGSEIYCRDVSIMHEENKIDFLLKNNVGDSLTLLEIIIPGCVDTAKIDEIVSNQNLLKSGKSKKISLICGEISEGSIEQEVEIIYAGKNSGLSHKNQIRIMHKGTGDGRGKIEGNCEDNEDCVRPTCYQESSKYGGFDSCVNNVCYWETFPNEGLPDPDPGKCDNTGGDCGESSCSCNKEGECISWVY